jgi:hypothetical protein
LGTVKKITLDLQRNKYEYIRVAEYDENSRTVIIKITNNGAIYRIDASKNDVHIKYKKSDGKYVVNDLDSKVLSILSDGTIKLVLSAQMCASYGNNEAELVIMDLTTKEIIHTCHFNVIVSKSVFDNNKISSKDEFKSFENALLRCEYLLDNLKPITISQIDALF